MNEIVFSARRQIDILAAVFYRETLFRFGRRSLGVLEEVGSIVIHVAIFSVMRIIMGVEVHDGMPLLPFTAVGVYCYWLFRTGLAQVSSAVFQGPKYQAFPQVTPLDIALARGGVNILLYIAIAFASFWGLELLGFSGPIGDPVRVLLILMAAGIFGLGIGLACSGLFYYVPIMRSVIVIGGLRLLSLVSGTFFVFPDIPYNLRPYAVWIPNLHMADMIRAAYFPSYRENWTSTTYVMTWIVGSLLGGLLVERAMRPVTTGGRAT